MPEHMHGGFGGFGEGWGGHRRWERRVGYPLFGGGMGLGGLGGFGSGFGGGGLLGDLLSGGIGYLAGRSMAQNQQASQYPPQYQSYPPQYQAQYQPSPQYQQPYQAQAPQYQAPPQGNLDTTQSNRLAQLKLLGQLREQGTLTEEEFQAEKQRILNG